MPHNNWQCLSTNYLWKAREYEQFYLFTFAKEFIIFSEISFRYRFILFNMLVYKVILK